MSASPTYSISDLELELPWSSLQNQDSDFNKILVRILKVLLVLFILVPWLPIFESEKDKIEDKAPELSETAKIVLKPLFIKNMIPPPVPKAKPKLKPKKIVGNVVKNVTPQEKTSVKNIGVAAFSKQLSSLRNSLDLSRLQKKNVSRSTGKTENTQRTALGKKNVTKPSAGIKNDTLKPVRSTQLASHQTTEVLSPLDDGNATASSQRSLEYGAKRTSGRDMESIRRTFEKYKGSINSLYVRALRKNPELQGKFLFQIIIEPDGSISKITLVTSELGDATLESKLLRRFSTIKFDKADVDPTPVKYTWNFLPS